MTAALSLRTKLIAVVTLILLGGFVATNVLNYQVSKGALRTTVLENELPLSSNNIYSEIQADLLRPIFISSMMANDTFVQDWTKEGEAEPERMVRYLKEIRDQYETFTSYFISAQTLRYYHFGGMSKKLDQNNPEDAWFFEASKASEPYVVNVDYNYQQGRAITIFINYRVLDADGAFLGITGVGLHLDSVARLVESYRTNFRRNVYFVDQDGLIKVHANADYAGKANIRDLIGLGAIAAEVLGQERGSYSYATKDDTILLTTRYIPELKWHLFIELPESQALQRMQRGFLRNLAIAPVVILATILLIGYTINIFQRRLEAMAITDKLTGLRNREFFDMSLGQSVKRYRRDGQPFALLMADIDHFKPINDKKGHLAGDEVIRRAAEIAAAQVRESDIICRWGGEEFTILAANCTLQDAHRLADAIQQAMRTETFFADEPDWRITVSLGITEVRADDDEKALVARADKALYQAKDLGRDRTVAL